MKIPDNRKGFSGWKLTLSKRPDDSILEEVESSYMGFRKNNNNSLLEKSRSKKNKSYQ